MEARAVLDGKGNSLHRVMSDANGMVTVILPDGEIRSVFVDPGLAKDQNCGQMLAEAEQKGPCPPKSTHTTAPPESNTKLR
jgi:hypothetical protein